MNWILAAISFVLFILKAGCSFLILINLFNYSNISLLFVFKLQSIALILSGDSKLFSTPFFVLKNSVPACKNEIPWDVNTIDIASLFISFRSATGAFFAEIANLSQRT